MNIEISEKYEPLFRMLQGENPNVDTVIMTGGRFSGKSWGVSLFSQESALQYDWKILYTRFTNLSIEDSIKSEVGGMLEDLKYDQYFEETKGRIKSKFGEGEMVFKGIKTGSGNQTANLKSLSGFNCFIVDEAEEIPDFETFKKVFYSIRSSTKRNLSILILNPTTKQHWVYKEFFEKNNVPDGFNGVKDNLMFIHTSYKDIDREHIPENIYNDFEKLKIQEPQTYNQIVMGGWITELEGQLIRESELNWFDPSKLIKEQANARLAIIDTATSGTDHLSMIILYIFGTDVYVVDWYFSTEDVNTTQYGVIDKINQHKLQTCIIETNYGGRGESSYYHRIQRQAPKFCRIGHIHSVGNKHTRIVSEAAFIKQFFYFDNNYSGNQMYLDAMSQTFLYNKDAKENKNIHDDAIDNIAQGAFVLKNMFGGVWQ